MLRAIKQFFDEHIAMPVADSSASGDHRLQVATSAMLIETARADLDIKPEELTAVAKAVQKTFEISAEETEQLLRLAEEEIKQATDYYQFTSLINRSFSAEEKVHVIELMWRIAFADGKPDKYEDHLVRKIAGLLHVSHQDFIAAKHRARNSSAPT